MTRSAWLLPFAMLVGSFGPGCGDGGSEPRIDAAPAADAPEPADAQPAVDGPDAGSSSSMCGELPPGEFECLPECATFTCDSFCVMYCGTDCYECTYVPDPYPVWHWEHQYIECSCPDAGL